MTAPLSPSWFKPAWQPSPEQPVEFRLRPLPLPALVDIRATWTGRQPSGAGFAAALRGGVIGWRNVRRGDDPVEFSDAALESFIEQPTQDFWVWSHQLVLELVIRATPSEAERKNSESPST